jgi:hypothetical protein
MELLLEDITIFTITGRRHLYKLGDMAYGQWLIYRGDLPVYYFDIFDEMYKDIDEAIQKAPCKYLREKFQKDKRRLSLSPNIKGIWSARVANKLFDIEKLPVNFFTDS